MHILITFHQLGLYFLDHLPSIFRYTPCPSRIVRERFPALAFLATTGVAILVFVLTFLFVFIFILLFFPTVPAGTTDGNEFGRGRVLCISKIN